MKYLIVTLLLTTATCQPTVKTWLLDELSNVLSTCLKDSCVSHPALVDALNKIMYALYTSKNIESVMGALPSPCGSDTWTKQEILSTLQKIPFEHKYRKFLDQARAQLAYQTDKNSIQVLIPAIDVSTWTLDDIKEALENPETNPNLLPYLQDASKKIQENTTSIYLDTISIATPIGLVKGNHTVLLPVKKIKTDTIEV